MPEPTTADAILAELPPCRPLDGPQAAALVAGWLEGREPAWGPPGPAAWASAVARLKPGGHAAVLCGPECLDLAAVAVRMAGLEVRDTLRWLGGPLAAILARKPPEGTVAGNVLKHGTGGLNIAACRVAASGPRPQRVRDAGRLDGNTYSGGEDGSLCGSRAVEDTTEGRWPANVLHDGSPEVLEAFAAFGEKKAGVAVRRNGGGGKPGGDGRTAGQYAGGEGEDAGYGDSGTAARFFAQAATRRDLARWLLALLVPPGGRVLALLPPGPPQPEDMPPEMVAS